MQLQGSDIEGLIQSINTFSTQKFRPSDREAFVKKEWEFIRGLVLPNKLKYLNILHFKGKMRYMTPKL